jgi:hypothetical protein
LIGRYKRLRRLAALLVPLCVAYPAQAEKFGGSIEFRDGASVSFHYLGVVNSPIDRKILGTPQESQVSFLSEIQELRFVDRFGAYDGQDNSQCQAIDRSGESITIEQCGFASGQLGYTDSDPMTRQLEYAVADARKISRIVIAGSPGNVRTNEKTGALFPEVYNFDPLTGAPLIWKKLETFSGTFVLRDGKHIEFVRIRPEDAIAPQEEIEDQKNLLDTKRGHQPTTLRFTEFAELHFDSELSDYHLSRANCTLITKARITLFLVDCRTRYRKLPYEYRDAATGEIRHSSLSIRGNIKSIIYSDKADRINESAIASEFPDAYKFDPYTGVALASR